MSTIPASFEDRVEAAEPGEDNTLIRWLRDRLPDLSGNAVRRLIETGKVLIDGGAVLEPTRRLLPGQRIELRMNAPRADRAHLAGPKLYHVDAQVVVCEKPTGIMTLPFEEEWDTLISRVQKVVPKVEKKGPIHPLRAVHRLDRECSGLVVFARTIPAQRHLQDQFAEHTVERAYLALVNGDVPFEGRRTIRTTLVPDRGDGLKGSARTPDQLGKEAITHVEVLERFPGVTFVRCELETGRTHQIRIHLAELGTPILGEPVYIRDYRGRLLESPRLMLHATTLGFVQPTTGEALRFESPAPEAMLSYLKGLRRGRQPGLKKPAATRRSGARR